MPEISDTDLEILKNLATDLANTGIFIADSSFDIIYKNKRCSQLLSLTEKDSINENEVWKFFEPSINGNSLKRELFNKGSINKTVPLVSDTESPQLVELNMRPLPSHKLSTDKTIWLGLVSETTDIKSAHKKIFEKTTDGVLIVDSTKTIQKVNSQINNMLGFSEEELVGSSLEKIIPPSKKEEHILYQKYFSKEPITDSATDSSGQFLLHKNGNTVPVEIKIGRLPENELLNIITIISDRSQLNKIREKLEHQMKFNNLLSEISKLSNQATEIEAACMSSMGKISQFLGWPAAHLYLPANDGSGEFYPTDQWYLNEDELFEPFRKMTRCIRFSPGEGMVGKVISSGVPQWYEDLHMNSDFVRRMPDKDLEIRTGLVIPLLSGEKVLGILEFFTTSPVSIDEEKRNKFITIGRQLGLAAQRINNRNKLIELNNEVSEAYSELNQQIDKNPLAMVKFDSEFRIIEWSERAEKKTGYTREDVLGNYAFNLNFFSQNEMALAKSQFRKLKSGEKDQDRFETVVQLKNGESMDVIIHASVLRENDGSLKSVLAFIENINVRKKFERELINREKKYHALFEDANDGIFLMQDMEFIECNQRTMEILGYNKDELIGKTPLDFSPDIQKDGIHSEIKAKEKIQFAQKGISQVFEWTHKNREGALIDVEVSLNSIELETGDYIQAIIRDLTEVKSAKQALARREKLFKTLFMKSPIPFVMINPEGKIQMTNKSYEKLFGFKETELLGRDLLAHQLPESRHNEIERQYEYIFSEKQESSYREDVRITNSGEEIILLIGMVPVFIDDEPIAAFGIYTNITKLRKTESILNESLEEKEILLSEIHHRVKNNLAIISGLLELESMNFDQDSDIFKVLTQSKLRIHSMARIHDQLYKSAHFADLNLENYIEDLMTEIQNSMLSSNDNIYISVTCDDISLNINQAIPSALIINELVTNAFKYAFNDEDAGNLDVSLTQTKNEVELKVKDDGCGLPEGFESMTNYSLGHTLVKQLTKQLEGDLQVESGVGEGTCYKITFRKKKKAGSAASRHFI